MSQTSSPRLRYDVVSIDKITSGSGREGSISIPPFDTKRSTSFSTTEEFPKQNFTPTDHISDQGILSDSLLSRFYEVTTSSNTILFRHRNVGFAQSVEIPHSSGVDISTLLGKLGKQAGNSPQLHQLEIIRWMRTKTGLSQERIARLVAVTSQTLHNWENGDPILEHNQQRLLHVKDVLERAISQYPTPDALTTWLDTPRGAEGYTPAMLLERNEIGKARLFAISHPSPHLKRAPSWVRRSIPEAFKSGEEHYGEALPPEYAEASTSLENDVDDDGGNSTIS